MFVDGGEVGDHVSHLDGVRRNLLTADCDGEWEERTDEDRGDGGDSAKPTRSSHKGADAESRGSEEEGDESGPILGDVDLVGLTKPQHNGHRGYYEGEKSQGRSGPLRPTSRHTFRRSYFLRSTQRVTSWRQPSGGG